MASDGDGSIRMKSRILALCHSFETRCIGGGSGSERKMEFEACGGDGVGGTSMEKVKLVES